MTLQETMKSFLKERRDGKFYDSSLVTYKRKLEVFFEFLSVKCGINNNNFEDILRGIGNDKIINSIHYYVKEYDVKFKVTVDNYFTVMKCYFDFISGKFDIRNENFDSTQRFIELKSLVDTKIKELKLDLSRQKSPIIDNVFDNLNEYCNDKIDSLSKDEIIKDQLIDSNDYNKPLVQFISAIIVKIVMLTGVKNQVIGKILYKDFDKDLNRLKINNFWIHLPDNLGIQLKKYILVRDSIVTSDSPSYPLFVNKQGVALDTDYNFMFETLKPIIGSKKAECVAKFTIMNMIRKGINSSIIQEFTSFGIDTYLHCQELVNEEKAKEDQKSKSRYLDSKIRSMDIFDKL